MDGSEHQTKRNPLPYVEAIVRIALRVRPPRSPYGLTIKPCSAMALERRLDTLSGPAAQRPLQPLPLRSLKRSLRSFDHGFRKEFPRDLPHEPLSSVVEDLSLYGLTQRKFEKPVIQERLA